MVDLPRRLLWIDGAGGLAVGLVMLLLRGWLSGWYGLPVALLTFLGVASLAYGSYSLTLATRLVRPITLIKLLVIANLTWAAICVAQSVQCAGVATPFGSAHLVLEGLYVGGLGCLEWRWRERLRHRC